MSKTLVVITGPTGIGKTALAIRIAQHFQTEILSADSRQFFKELNIGVARPSDEELQLVKHHFIAFLSIHDHYSAGAFSNDARALLIQLYHKHDVVVCVGGSGLYIDALINGFDDLPHDNQVRMRLSEINRVEGIQKLQEQLRSLDPEYYNQVDIHNPHRVIRALEVIELTGQKFSELRKQNSERLPYKIVKLGLTARKDYVYDRINARVDQMVASGLIQEVSSLVEHQNLNSLNTVGYKEIFAYLNNQYSLDEAISKIKQHTRNYAKRQETYWRRDSEIYFIDSEKQDTLAQALARIGLA